MSKQKFQKLFIFSIGLLLIISVYFIVGLKILQAETTCSTDQDCLADQFCQLTNCASPGTCIAIPELCPTLYDPVCGCDGKTYPNNCSANVSKVSVDYKGECKEVVVECTSCQDCQNKINSASEGDIIKLASDISYDGPVWGTCIDWQNNGITFDCQNHLINGTLEKTPDYGIAMLGGKNNRIINCRMTNFLNSIYLKSSSHNEIAENEVLNGFGASCGISLVMDSSENRVVNNVVSGVMWGIFVETDSNLNSLSGNKVSNCLEKGIFLALSSLNVLKNNQMVNNLVNLVFYEENNLEHYEHSIDMSNTVNGKPVKYCYYNKNSLSGNCSKIIENMDLGHLTVAGGDNLVVKNNKVDNGDGINLVFTKNSEIHSNKLSNNNYGIYSLLSSYNEIRNNSISNSSSRGIYLLNKSLSNNIINNTIRDSYDGIYLQKNSDFNVIDNNKISSSNSGIRLSKCSSAHVIKNILLKNTMGIHLSNSSRSTIKSNNISEGYIGVYVYDSPRASITYNTIKNHVLDENNCPHCGTGIRIQMDGSGSATISNNLISDNAQGILIGDSHGHRVINNSILDNSDTGIYLFRGTVFNTVDGNRICFNTKYDIHCQPGTSASGADVYDTKEGCPDIERTNPCFSDGTLIKLPDDPKVYLIKNCKKKWIKTIEEFQQEGYQWSDIQETNSEVVSAYADYLEVAVNLIRAANQAEVYKVINNKRLWIPTTEAFIAMGNNWSDIEDIDESEVNQYPRLKLAKLADDPKVYYLTESGFKKHIPSVEVFNSYGNNWEDIVKLLADELNVYSDVVLIKVEDGPKVYKLENGQKQWIKTNEAFNRLGFNWNEIALVNTTEINSYTDGVVIE